MEIMTNSSISESICSLFTDSQYNFSSHRKNIRSLVKLFNNSCDKIEKLQDFYLASIHCLNVILSLKRHEDLVNRMMKFLVGFIVSLANSNTIENDDNNNAQNHNHNLNKIEFNNKPIITDFIENIMKWSLDYIDVKARNVRARLGQLLVACVNSLDEISENLWQLLQGKMYERLFDKEAVVRIQSVYVFARLQSLEIEGTNVTIGDVFVDLLRHDTSPEVRKAVLREIDISSEESLSIILERAHDVDVGVRKILFSIRLKDVDFGQLSMEQREGILRFGLGDRESVIRDACVDLILNYWSASVDYNIIKFLSHLNVISNLEIAELFLKAIQKVKPDFFGHEDLFKMDIFLQNLTKETALLMRVLLENKQENEKMKINSKSPSFDTVDMISNNSNSSGNGNVMTVQDCLPELCTIASLIKKTYEDWLICQGDDREDSKEEYEFIIKQLLSCAELADFGDEVGRRSMIEIVLELICNFQLGESLFRKLCDILVTMTCNPQEFLQITENVLLDTRDIFMNMEFEIDIRTIAHLRGLEIVNSALRMEGSNPLLYNILDIFIIPAVNSELLSVQMEGLTALGLCCMNDSVGLALANEYQDLLVAFIELEQLETKTLAIQIAFDIICTFPKESNFDKLLNALVSCLYHQDEQVHCISAEGFAKILLHQFHVNDQILEGLFYLYLHPSNSGNIRLRQCLSYFWPCYSQGREEEIVRIAPFVIKTCGMMEGEGVIHINKIVDYLCLLIRDSFLLLKLLEELSWQVAKNLTNKSLLTALGRVPIIQNCNSKERERERMNNEEIAIGETRVTNEESREKTQKIIKKLLLMLGMILKGMSSDKTGQNVIRRIIANLVEIDDPTFFISNPEEMATIKNKLEELIMIEESNFPINNKTASSTTTIRKKFNAKNNSEQINLGANIIDDIDDIIS